MTPYFESDRIYLREFTADDAKLLCDLDSDPDVMKYLSDGKPNAMKDILKNMPAILSHKERYGGKLGIWIAQLKSNDEFIGWFHLRPGKSTPDDLKNLELGYRLKKKFWRQGYGFEMSHALTEKSFRELNADTVWARTHELNQGSRAIMEKLGMKLTKHYIEKDFPGADQRGVIYSITKSEWGTRS